MERRRGTASVFRAAALWLLALCMFLGPAGVGSSAALASAPEDCDIECPCDDAAQAHSDHDEDRGCGDCEAEEAHPDTRPCEDVCPDDCNDCSCCFSVAVELGSIPTLCGARTHELSGTPEPRDAPATGSQVDVFRPPRSLA